MTEITIPFSLYIACTNHQEYEKQFFKTKKVLCDFKQTEIFTWDGSLWHCQTFDSPIETSLMTVGTSWKPPCGGPVPLYHQLYHSIS